MFGQQEGPEVMVFPRELGWLPTQLFHLRRGPLLGPLLQNSDDPVCLRHLFLRGALEECIRMMAPDMFSLKVSRARQILVWVGLAVSRGQGWYIFDHRHRTGNGFIEYSFFFWLGVLTCYHNRNAGCENDRNHRSVCSLRASLEYRCHLEYLVQSVRSS